MISILCFYYTHIFISNSIFSKTYHHTIYTEVMETEKDLLMFYQTALRNVGLFTSVSLALLGYSRFYRGKNKIYNLAFIILSLAILICAIIISKYLIQDLEKMSKKVDTTYLEKWVALPKYIMVINVLVGAFGLVTLVREIRKMRRS